MRFFLACLLFPFFQCGDQQKAPGNDGALIAYDKSLVGEPVQDLIGKAMVSIQSKTANGQPEEIAAGWQKLGMIFQAYQLRNEASQAYEQAMALAPGNWEPAYLLGLVSLEMVAPKQAAEALGKALDLNPGHALTAFRLGNLARNQGDLGQSEKLFQQAIDADPELAVALVGLAEIQLERHQPEKALEKLTRAAQLQPEASRTQYLLSQAYRDLGQREKAQAALAKSESSKKALTFRDSLQDGVDAYAEIGRNFVEEGDMAMRIGKVGVALDAYQLAAAYNPNDFVAIAKMGNAQLRNGDLNAAIESYKKASGINPGNALLQFNIGSAFMEAGRFEQASGFFEKALLLEPMLAEAAMRLADSFRLRGDWNAALAQYDRALDIDPAYASAKMGRAICLLALDRRAEAKTFLVETWQESHDNPVIGRVLTRVLVSSPEPAVRDGNLAMGIIEILEEKAPGNYLLESKAMAYAELGDFGKALETVRIAMGSAQIRGDATAMQKLSTQAQAYQNKQAWHHPYPQDHPVFHQPSY